MSPHGRGIGVLDYDIDGWPDLSLAHGSGEPPSGQHTRSNKLLVNRVVRSVISLRWPKHRITTAQLGLSVGNVHMFALRIAGHSFRMLPEIMMNVGRRFEAYEVNFDCDYWDAPAPGRTTVKLAVYRDGAIDLVVAQLDYPFAFFESQTQAKHLWIQLQHVLTKSERNAVGARIEVVANQGPLTQW